MRTNGPGQSALLLLDAVAVLKKRNIPYAVIGAMAGSVHGIVRASMDADAVLSLSVHEASGLEGEFRTAGFETQLRRGDPEDPIPALLALSDTFENRVDLLVGLRGLEPAAFSRTAELTFHGVPLRIISLEDFVAMKVFAGGPQDLLDARGAITAASKTLDLVLLRRLAAGYGRDPSATLERLLVEAGR